MKRLLALLILLTVFSLCLPALAEDNLYIANPNPADRLNLRTRPDKAAESLGKYYNGAPIEQTGPAHSGWIPVRVGMGAASLSGYMNSRYLSSKAPASAMPQYTTIAPITAYQQPDAKSPKMTVPGGRLLSQMGLSDGWLHLMVHTNESEGNYACFVRTGVQNLVALKDGKPVNVYISNPDPKDRLHLRVSPSVESESLGKYYNGAVATLKGFAQDGEWVKADLYGRTGYLKRSFVYLEGQGQNPTYYGIPTVKAVGQTARLYSSASRTSAAAAINAGTAVDVLGVVDEEWLHVRVGERIAYMLWTDTSFVDKSVSGAPQGLVVGNFKPKEVSFAANKTYPVYLGPGTQYVRKGTVSTNGWIQVFGRYQNWIMIQYEISPDQYRIGWIQASALPSNTRTNEVSFEFISQTIIKPCALTDDPINGQRPLLQLQAAAEVTALADFGDHYYIQVVVNGETYWGFVDGDCITKG